MRVLIICALTCCLGSAYGIFGPELTEKLHGIEDKCLSETQTSVATIDILRRVKTLPDTGILDKFAVCILKRFSILDKNGSVNPDVKTYYLISDDGRKKEYAKECNTLTGKNSFETARKILSCLLRTDIYFIDFRPRAEKPLPMISRAH